MREYGFELIFELFLSVFDLSFEGGEFPSIFDDVDLIFDKFGEFL